MSVSAEQTLVGAMGCASWRSHLRLKEQVSVAGGGRVVQGTRVLTTGAASSLSLNEVGVTDLVMVTLWRFGPRGAAYAVTSGAESHQLGADIAIVDSRRARILIYQAKLAVLSGRVLQLKSEVTYEQLRLLRRQDVELNDQPYEVTGRLAIYQADYTPFIQCCPSRWTSDSWEWPWELRRFVPTEPDGSQPGVGRFYYENVLAQGGCSPSGVLAARVPATTGSRKLVEYSSTWPWEFDTYEWFIQGRSQLDKSGRSPEQSQLGPPDFEEYRPDVSEGPAAERATSIASELAEKLHLRPSQQMYVILVE